MLYIKYSKNKEKLSRVVEADRNFKSVERQAAEVINLVTGSKLMYPEGKEAVDVCQAIQQIREESELKGAVEMCRKFGISLAETIRNISEQFGLSEAESDEAVKKYW